MSRVLPALVLALTLGLWLSACDSTEPDTGGNVALMGQVIDRETTDPIVGAIVQVLPDNIILETDSLGRYATEVQVDSVSQLTIVATKEGFSTENITLVVVGGRTVDVPVLRLRRLEEEGPESGQAANILLLSQSDEAVGVRESGSNEVAQIIFQVADSLGRPITAEHAVDVAFSFGDRPGGEEFLFPTLVKTDGKGQAEVSLSSGTRAGVVQIVARTVLNGITIRSLPVAIAIHGGLPDQPHFSIGPEKVNFPGLRFYGLIDRITVIVGDKYANPVRPGTAVYFTAAHGVIQGSILTDRLGRGTAELLSANPLPPDGICLITGSTADENQVGVSDQTAVVFSGVPVIRVSPVLAILGQTYEMTVTDQNGNPLVEGTSISVRVEGTNVKAVGNTSTTLDDTAFLGGLSYENVVRGPGITQFVFAAVPDVGIEERPEEPVVEAITITVSGENGTLELVLTPTGSPFSPSEKAVGEVDGDGSAVFKLTE